MSRPPLDKDYIRSQVRYDAERGEVVWIANKGSKIRGRKAGNSFRGWYEKFLLNGRSMYSHRVIWMLVHGDWPKNHIDHIDGNRLNNRVENLRDVTNQVNSQNRRKVRNGTKTGFLGVHPEGRRFKSAIQCGPLRTYLGTFDTPEEAHEAYLAAKRKMHEGCTI